MVKGASIGEIRKKVTKTYELISTSYHEAGHAVFALLSAMKVYSVQVFEHKTLKRIHGYTEYKSFDINKSHYINGLLEQEIGLSYAGWLAEKHYFQIISGSDKIPMFIKEGSCNDLLEVQKMLQKYNIVPAGKKRALFKRKLIRETMNVLIEHWGAVELVSHHLFKHKKMSYFDLQNLLTSKSKNRRFWRNQFKLIDQNFDN